MNNHVLFVVVGASGSGKGVLLRSVRDMGERHIVVINKGVTRKRKTTDGSEMTIYRPDELSNEDYDIVYANYLALYGIRTSDIWEALSHGRHALLICSNFASIDKDKKPIPDTVPAIPTLRRVFGPLMKLVYLHSHIDQDMSQEHQSEIAAADLKETRVRKKKIPIVRGYYVDNIGRFDHVLLNVGEPEDLSDQVFRLISFYDKKEGII
jgi:ABC-type dipeptide/oligopeptide/nickel transport system ATPase component